MSEEVPKKRFGFFTKKSSGAIQTEQEDTAPFDENYFSFELKGGPYQDGLIEVSAIVKAGPHKGMPLPLHCEWYRSFSQADLQVIEFVTGAYYQPTADDIGCKICVKAVPVSEVKEYIGMPVFGDVGPIQLNPSSQYLINEMLKQGNAVFPLSLIGARGIEGNIPKSAMIKMNDTEIGIYRDDGVAISKCTFSSDFPNVELNRRTNVDFTMNFSSSVSFDLRGDTSNDRDTFAVCLRMFAGKRQVTDQSQLLLKIQQLTDSLAREAKEKLELKEQLDEIKLQQEEISSKEVEKTLEIASQITRLQEEIDKREKIISGKDAEILQKEHEKEEMQEQVDKKEEIIEDLSKKISFLKQDLSIYSIQSTQAQYELETLREKSKQQEMQIVSMTMELNILLNKIRNCDRCRNIPAMENGSNGTAESTESELQSEGEPPEILDYKREIRSLKHQIKKLNSDIKAIEVSASDEINRAHAEKNYYKSKAESLAQENDRMLSKVGKNPRELTEFAKQRKEFEDSKVEIDKSLKELRDECAKYKLAMEITQRKLQEEISKNVELNRKVKARSSIKGDGSNAFQHIINSLTERLTDKEAEMDTQKDINKQLMNRVAELEAIVSTFHSVH